MKTGQILGKSPCWRIQCADKDSWKVMPIRMLAFMLCSRLLVVFTFTVPLLPVLGILQYKAYCVTTAVLIFLQNQLNC